MTDVKSTVTISVNGRSVEAAPGELLIEAAERAGSYIPRFCYHPRMEPVGMCRMCLVEVDGPRGPTLQPACYIKVNDGMNVVTDSEKVKKAQDGVLEFLLANHPLDCPVCDKGGECPLQDQTLSHGSGETRFIEEKRHFVKPVEIGELVLLDRERCIQCARCTRFSSDVAGDTEIAFAGRGDQIEVATSPTKPFDSVFSGNTVQICPVGALTAKPYRFTARPWDLEQAESTCTTCAVGCRVAVQSSGNRLTRLLGVDSEPVNHGWLCDKGRFTLDSIDGHGEAIDPLNAETRIREPLVRDGDVLRPASWGEALERAATILKDAASSPNGVGAIGGAALTNEGAFAWERFVRQVLGSDHVDAQFGDGLDGGLLQALPKATIDEAANARVVMTLTGDLREELPVLFLRLRENFVQRHNNLIEFSFGPSGLRPVAAVTMPVRPGEAHVVAKALTTNDARVAKESTVTDAQLDEARALLGESGEGVVFIVGRPNFAESAVVMETAIRTLAERFTGAKFLPALRRGNVMGALDMGLGPRLRPGHGYDASCEGRDTLAQLEAMRSGEQTAVLLLGGGLLGNVLDPDAAVTALETAKVVVVTGHGGRTLAHADVVLPAVVQHERHGTVTNIEGRVTNVTPKISSPGSAWNDVAIAAELAEQYGQSLGLDSVELCAKVIEETTGYPALSVMNDLSDEGAVVSRVKERIERRALDPMAFPGIKSTNTVGLAEFSGALVGGPVTTGAPRAVATLEGVAAGRGVEVGHYDAYGLALHVSRRLYDHGIAVQGSPALANLVARTTALINHFDLDRLGLVTGDVVQVNAPKGPLSLQVAMSDETPRGTIGVVFGSLDEEGHDGTTSALYDPTSVIMQMKLETK
ncbi:MAG TPA: NADH-quinone oxidoreductase subunit NuoG [Acidimicrobiales bacterium]|nr:NADH-quinone oxidoreductase subunit NuoG [Acidimicrobiales bacterium]